MQMKSHRKTEHDLFYARNGTGSEYLLRLKRCQSGPFPVFNVSACASVTSGLRKLIQHF